MYWQSTAGQQAAHYLYDNSGVTVQGTKLVVPQHKSRAHFIFQNLSATATMYLEFGSARATCTVSGGKVTGTTITNGGFGFTRAPKVHFLGAGYGGNTASVPVGQPGFPDPGDAGYAAPHQNNVSSQIRAEGTAVLTGGVVTSIAISNPGSGYGSVPPFIFMSTDPLDANGCADPFYNSTLSGLLLTPGGNYFLNGTFCTTDPISVYCASSGQAYTYKWAP